MEPMSCPESGCAEFGKVSFCNQFCRACGTELAPAQFKPVANSPCPFCKASVSDDDDFCGSCGRDLPRLFFYIFSDSYLGHGVIAKSSKEAWDALARYLATSYYHYRELSQFSVSHVIEIPRHAVDFSK